MNEHIKPYTKNPSSTVYKTEGTIGKHYKSQSNLNKVDPKVKKMTYIENIEAEELKYKHPGVGKYNLLQKRKGRSASLKSAPG